MYHSMSSLVLTMYEIKARKSKNRVETNGKSEDDYVIC
jgi:hypothetical protein